MEGERSIRKIIFILILFVTLFIFFPPMHSLKAESVSGPVYLDFPFNNKEVIDVRPFISVRVDESSMTEHMLVILDGMDVTGIVNMRPDGFEFRPVDILPEGIHFLSVTLFITTDKIIESDFTFRSLHPGPSRNAYFDNETTAVFEGLFNRHGGVSDQPHTKVEGDLGSNAGFTDGGFDLSLNTSLRYLDQDHAVFAPQHKGLSLAGYLLRGEYQKDDRYILTEVGDVQIDGSSNTINLLKRGGNFMLGYRDVRVSLFHVMSDQAFEYRGQTGLEDRDDGRIKGITAEAGFLSNRVKLKGIYVTGSESGSSFGVWSPAGERRGNVFGLVLDTELIERRLDAEAEIDFSSFDPDMSDEFHGRNDTAYRMRADGRSGRYSYGVLYEYTGPDYEVVGNYLQKDREGLTLRGGLNYPIHSLNLLFSRFNDNVKGNTLYPTIYTYLLSGSYMFTKFMDFPIGISYMKSVLNSTREPDVFSPLKSETDTVSVTLNYIRDEWRFSLSSGYSLQNDRNSENDTESINCSFSPAYYAGHFSLSPFVSYNRSKYHLTDVAIDTFTASVDLRGDISRWKVLYEFSGSYARSLATDASSDMYVYNSSFRIARIVAEHVWWLANPTVGVRGRYNNNIDKAADESSDDFLTLFVISTGLPFSI